MSLLDASLIHTARRRLQSNYCEEERDPFLFCSGLIDIVLESVGPLPPAEISYPYLTPVYNRQISL